MRMAFLLWGAVLCMGCSPVGASNGGEPAAHDEAAAAKELEALTKSMEVTEGSFRLLTIGESKKQALAGLREMGVSRVMPGLGEQVAVTKAEDLSELQDAEGVIIGAGDVTIAFDGNDVQRVTVAPIFPAWNALLHGIRTRQEAFRALAQILNQSKDVEVRALAVDADSVYVPRITPEGQALLDKYNHWSVSHDAKDGYVYMDMEFAQGVLRRISVLESPAAL
jgi:hypothetical protein